MNRTTELFFSLLTKGGNPQLLHKTIHQCPSILNETYSGVKPLHIAVEKQDFQLVKTMIAHSDNVDIFDEFNRTPLHFCRDSSIAELLITNGANVNAKDLKGQSPLKAAIDLFMSVAAPRLVFHAEKPTQKSLCQLIIFLIRKRAKIEDGKFSSLNALLSSRPTSLGEWLSEKFIRLGVSLNKKDTAGRTPFINAIRHMCSLGFVKTMLTNGADPNIADRQGETAIFYALRNKQLELVQLLYKFKANVNHSNKLGRTAIFYSDSYEFILTLHKLFGADVSVVDGNGKFVSDNFRNDAQAFFELGRNGVSTNQDRFLEASILVDLAEFIEENTCRKIRLDSFEIFLFNWLSEIKIRPNVERSQLEVFIGKRAFSIKLSDPNYREVIVGMIENLDNLDKHFDLIDPLSD